MKRIQPAGLKSPAVDYESDCDTSSQIVIIEHGEISVVSSTNFVLPFLWIIKEGRNVDGSSVLKRITVKLRQREFSLA